MLPATASFNWRNAAPSAAKRTLLGSSGKSNRARSTSSSTLIAELPCAAPLPPPPRPDTRATCTTILLPADHPVFCRRTLVGSICTGSESGRGTALRCPRTVLFPKNAGMRAISSAGAAASKVRVAWRSPTHSNPLPPTPWGPQSS